LVGLLAGWLVGWLASWLAGIVSLVSIHGASWTPNRELSRIKIHGGSHF